MLGIETIFGAVVLLQLERLIQTVSKLSERVSIIETEHGMNHKK